MFSSPNEVTRLLVEWSNGDETALERLVPIVEAELHRLASRYLRREIGGHVLQTTALVNEAYLRLIEQPAVRWQNRAHFFGIAARLMRRILVDYARRDRAAKRGGGAVRLSLEHVTGLAHERDLDLVALDDALTALARIDARQSEIVELRFFGGLRVDETAEVLGLSPATVTRDWNLAKAWLRREMGGDVR
jgi:RNA polymerase sigma factor (TIGR02999 family)